MTAFTIKKDWWFFAALFVAWFSTVYLSHNGYRYFGTALPSIPLGQQTDLLVRQGENLTASISELQSKIKTENDPVERAHIIHNIGQSFYDIYSISRQRSSLDSSREYFARSVQALPTVARFHYNLARVFTEMAMHANAQVEYEKALDLDPSHVLAMHNLGLLTYFEQGNREKARGLLLRALSVNASLPICNYVLGEIALDLKEKEEALRRFREEIVLAGFGYGRNSNIPARSESIDYAVRMAHIELAGMFSTQYPHRDSAQAHFNQYFKMEPDPQKKQEALDKIKRYWVIGAQ